MAELTYSETLVTTTCWCGIHLAIPANLLRYARNHKNYGVFCPLGHEFVFSGTFEEKYHQEQERRRAAERRAQANRDLLEAEERSHAATRGVVTKLKKRAAGGACPCCNRTFQNLQRHMATKHPEFETAGSGSQEPNALRTRGCRIEGCTEPAEWTRGRYAGRCRTHQHT